jgi:hypothetical protein
LLRHHLLLLLHQLLFHLLFSFELVFRLHEILNFDPKQLMLVIHGTQHMKRSHETKLNASL